MKHFLKKYKNNKLTLVFAIVALLLIVVGITFAFFNASFKGIKTTTLNINGLEFTYLEESNDLIIANTLSLTDEEGIIQDKYFDFTVSLKSGKDLDLDYIIYLTKDNNSTMSDGAIKIYLTDQNDQEIIAPCLISELYKYNLINNSKIIYETNITSNNNVKTIHYYRLRLWLINNTELNEELDYYEKDNEKGYIQTGGTYKFKINVATSDVNESYPCFEYRKITSDDLNNYPDLISSDVGSIIITDYLCGKDNSNGLDEILDVVIPNKIDNLPVVTIASANSFTKSDSFANKGITSVILSNKLKVIGNNSFINNEISGTLVIPANVITIGTSSFSGDTATVNNKINKLVFEPGSKLKNIESNAFHSNRLTGTLTIPASVEKIEGWAFTGTWDGKTNQIQTIVFEPGSKLIYIGDSVFYRNKLTGTLTIPANVEYIGSFTFFGGELGNKITGLEFESGSKLEKIDYGAFLANPIEGILTIPDSVTSIGTLTFDNIRISSLDISPNSNLTTIGDDAFSHNPDFSGTVLIPSKVTSIGSNSFLETKITSIINKTGKTFNWELIVTGISGSEFVTGSIINKYNNNTILNITD